MDPYGPKSTKKRPKGSGTNRSPGLVFTAWASHPVHSISSNVREMSCVVRSYYLQLQRSKVRMINYEKDFVHKINKRKMI